MECVHIRTCNEKSPWGKEKERIGKEEGKGDRQKEEQGTEKRSKGRREKTRHHLILCNISGKLALNKRSILLLFRASHMNYRHDIHCCHKL